MIALSGLAQVTDFNKIVPDEETRPKTFEDYLVQLAWTNNPQSKILGHETKIAELESDLTKREWMKNLQAQWNVNEISLSNIVYPDNDLFVAIPIWNVTATLNLNTVANRKKEIEASKQKVEISKQSTNMLKLQLRAMVLERYHTFNSTKDILKIATEAEQNASENSSLLKELFNEGKVNFEDVTRADLAYTNARMAKVNAETDIKITKIALEELIGVKYEDAEKFGKSYKKED